MRFHNWMRLFFLVCLAAKSASATSSWQLGGAYHAQAKSPGETLCVTGMEIVDRRVLVEPIEWPELANAGATDPAVKVLDEKMVEVVAFTRSLVPDERYPRRPANSDCGDAFIESLSVGYRLGARLLEVNGELVVENYDSAGESGATGSRVQSRCRINQRAICLQLYQSVLRKQAEVLGASADWHLSRGRIIRVDSLGYFGVVPRNRYVDRF